ncbi:MAG TPA: glycoside hydrolase family 5 protein [bacterium]|nr:glycoside hydrolase family 5 protein [bacterium]
MFSICAALFLCASVSLALPPQLHVSGNQIQTDTGCSVRLKGVNVDGLEFDSSGNQGPGIANTAAESVTAWGANIVRIPLNQDWWFGCGGGGANYQTIVDNVVNFCNANNVYVLLDLHWSGRQTGATDPCGTGWGSDSSTKQQYMPDDNSVTFWTSVATRYANNPSVLFDIYNEPYDYDGNGWSIWRDGGTGTSYSFHTPGMQALLSTIRGTGANNVLVVGGVDYAYDLTGLVNGSCGGVPCALTDTAGGQGVIYASHIYPWKGSSPWIPANGDQKISPAAAYYPVFIGEFGEGNAQGATVAGYSPNPDTNGTWDQTLLQWMDGTNSAGYAFNGTAWDMHPGSSPILISNWSFTPTTWHGVPVKNWLATPAPNCIPTFTPTVTYTPTPCGYPGNTCTPTFTPTPTPTPSNLLVAFPNPWPDPQNPGNTISFYYQNDTAADQVQLKVFTLAYRKIYEDDSLPASQGPQPPYTLDFNKAGLNLSNGLYYFAVIWQRGGTPTQKVMKVLIQR